METDHFAFSASRFKHKREIHTEISKKESPQSILLQNAVCEVLRINKHLPTLLAGEKLIEFNSSEPDIAICITTRRVLLYSTLGVDPNPYVVEFYHDDADTPCVSIVPNPHDKYTPNVAIVSSNGHLRYIETLNFVPSLTVVQNEESLNIKLYSNESIVKTQWDNSLGLLITTSQKRIFVANFNSHFGSGSTGINLAELYNNRSLLDTFVSKSFSKISKGITQIISLNESPVIRKIFILEDNGFLAILKHVLSTGVYTVEKKIELSKNSFGLSNVEFLDMAVINDESILLLVKPEGGSISILKINLTNAENLTIAGVYQIEQSDSISNAKIFLLLNHSMALVSSNNKIFFFDANFQSEIPLSANLNHSIILKSNVTIYSVNSITVSSENNDNNNNNHNINSNSNNVSKIKIGTDSGLLVLNFFSLPKLLSKSQGLVERIEQNLIYGSLDSQISFDIDDISINLSENDIESAVGMVISRILNNNLTNLNLKESSLPLENLVERVQLAQKLIEYIGRNFKLSTLMTQQVFQSTEYLGLASSLLSSCKNFNLETELSFFINSKVEKNLAEYLSKNPTESLNLLTNFIENKLKNLNSNEEIINFGHFITTIFKFGYLDIDKNIKSLDNFIPSPIFTNYSKLLNILGDSSGLLENIFKASKISTIDSNITEFVLINLSLFLYYATYESFNFFKNDQIGIKNFSELLLKNKNNWITPFCALHYEDDLILIADQYSDFVTLARLIDSKRIHLLQLENDQIEREQVLLESAEAEGRMLPDIEEPNEDILELQRDVENLFNHYLKNYNFAEALFDYYIARGEIGHLLNAFNNSVELNRYLSENECIKFEWIKGIRDNNWNVGNRLLSWILNKNNENKNFRSHCNPNDELIKNKQILLSLSKLCSIANNNSFPEKIDNELSVLALNNQIKSFLPKNDPVDKNFSNLINRVSKTLKENKQVDPLDLVNYLTLYLDQLDNKIVVNFSLKLLDLIGQSTTIGQDMLKLLLRRLLFKSDELNHDNLLLEILLDRKVDNLLIYNNDLELQEENKKLKNYQSLLAQIL